MKKTLGIYLAASLMVGTALSQNAPGAAEPTLPPGIKQFIDGDLAGAVFTLEAVIRTLGVEPALHAKDLSQAYLYRGAAFVGLGQEENAKGSFAAALQYDKTLRIGEDKFSPRVVRVFEAARTGKTRSVLLPSSNVGKKAGISALGIAGIVGGVAAIGGGVAAAAHGPTSPAPTPIPAGFSFTVTATVPSAGGVVTPSTKAGENWGLQLTGQVTVKGDAHAYWTMFLRQGMKRCLGTQQTLATRLDGGSVFAPQDWLYAASSPASFRVGSWTLQDCGPSFVTDNIEFDLLDGVQSGVQTVSNIGWTFHP